jgi:hypothetical protein
MKRTRAEERFGSEKHKISPHYRGSFQNYVVLNTECDRYDQDMIIGRERMGELIAHPPRTCKQIGSPPSFGSSCSC